MVRVYQKIVNAINIFDIFRKLNNVFNSQNLDCLINLLLTFTDNKFKTNIFFSLYFSKKEMPWLFYE